MKIEFMVAMTLLLPMSSLATAQAQLYPQPSYGSSVVIVPPAFYGGGNTGAGDSVPFPSPQAGQRQLLEMLETGGIEQHPRRDTAPGCIYSGQVYPEGAVVRIEAGRQLCGPRAGAEPDASGQMPLSWRPVSGE